MAEPSIIRAGWWGRQGTRAHDNTTPAPPGSACHPAWQVAGWGRGSVLGGTCGGLLGTLSLQNGGRKQVLLLGVKAQFVSTTHPQCISNVSSRLRVTHLQRFMFPGEEAVDRSLPASTSSKTAPAHLPTVCRRLSVPPGRLNNNNPQVALPA